MVRLTWLPESQHRLCPKLLAVRVAGTWPIVQTPGFVMRRALCFRMHVIVIQDVLRARLWQEPRAVDIVLVLRKDMFINRVALMQPLILWSMLVRAALAPCIECFHFVLMDLLLALALMQSQFGKSVVRLTAATAPHVPNVCTTGLFLNSFMVNPGTCIGAFADLSKEFA